MKKIIIFTTALLIAAVSLSAQTKGELKSIKYEASAAARSIRKEKFKMVELGNIKDRLEQYFLKVNSGCQQVVGLSEGCVTANLAKISAINNAANEYASNAGGTIRGRITSEASTISEEQTDALVAAYERLVLKEIKGELIPFITLMRQNKKGEYDVRVYCIVDYETAHQARLRAMQRALEESQLAQKYGSQISNWVDEGFNKLNK